MPSYFVTGTDTHVGKTLVSCALLHAFAKSKKKVVGMKPIATGCSQTSTGFHSDDAEKLGGASSIKAPLELINPYAFAPPVSPHIAAEKAGTKIDLTAIEDAFHKLKKKAEVVIVEGIGGFKVPIGVRATTIDVVRALRLPLILVVGIRLGCLSHALLTLDVIHTDKLRLEGWVANCIDPDMQMIEETIRTLQQRIAEPFLGKIPFIKNITPQQAASYLDLYRLSEIQITPAPEF